MNKNQESKELFRHNLKKLRKLQGLNQAQLAKKIGVASNSISNYENGVSTPDFKIIDKIVEALEVSREALFGDPIDPAIRSAEEVDLIAALDLLESKHPEDRAVISQLKSGIMKLQAAKIHADQKVIRLLEDKQATFEAMEKLGVKIQNPS